MVGGSKAWNLMFHFTKKGMSSFPTDELTPGLVHLKGQ
jgi:hypothetical protein